VIGVRNAFKQIGGNTIVDGISFTAPDGCVTGLLGPNGAGKTTTLRLLSGLMRPDRGSIEVDGSMGVLPDEFGMYVRLTGREHIRYFGKLRGLDGPDLERRTEQLLESLNMGSVGDRRAAGYSRGERLKIALACALVHDPRNVVLDEPTNGLDVMSTRAVRAFVRELRAQGRCVLFSSHVMQEVSALCDSILVMAKGQIVAHGTPGELLDRTGAASLEDAFVRLAGEAAAVVEAA